MSDVGKGKKGLKYMYLPTISASQKLFFLKAKSLTKPLCPPCRFSRILLVCFFGSLEYGVNDFNCSVSINTVSNSIVGGFGCFLKCTIPGVEEFSR